MICHIGLFTAKDKAHIDQMIDGLSVLTAITHARRLEVARSPKTDHSLFASTLVVRQAKLLGAPWPTARVGLKIDFKRPLLLKQCRARWVAIRSQRTSSNTQVVGD